MSKKFPLERVRGPIVGWRWWRTSLDHDRPLLSFTTAVQWDGPSLIAEDCSSALAYLKQERRDGMLGSGPGIYAVKRPNAVRAMELARPMDGVTEETLLATVHVHGSVELFGKLKEYDEGYRSEKAIIRELKIPLDQQFNRSWHMNQEPLLELATSLETRYQVDVSIVSRLA